MKNSQISGIGVNTNTILIDNFTVGICPDCINKHYRKNSEYSDNRGYVTTNCKVKDGIPEEPVVEKTRWDMIGEAMGKTEKKKRGRKKSVPETSL